MEERRAPAVGDDMMEFAIPVPDIRRALEYGEADERPVRPERQRHRHVPFHEEPGCRLRVVFPAEVDKVDGTDEAVQHHLARTFVGIEHDGAEGGGAVGDVPDRRDHSVRVHPPLDPDQSPDVEQRTFSVQLLLDIYLELTTCQRQRNAAALGDRWRCAITYVGMDFVNHGRDSSSIIIQV